MAKYVDPSTIDLSDLRACLTIFDLLNDENQLYICNNILNFSEKYKEWFGEDLVLEERFERCSNFLPKSVTFVNGVQTNPYKSWANALPTGNWNTFVDTHCGDNIDVNSGQLGRIEDQEQLAMKIKEENVAQDESKENRANFEHQDVINIDEFEQIVRLNKLNDTETTDQSSFGTFVGSSETASVQTVARISEWKSVLPLEHGFKKTSWSSLPDGGESNERRRIEREKETAIAEEIQLDISLHDNNSKRFIVQYGNIVSRVYYNRVTRILEDTGLLVEKDTLRIVVDAGSTALTVAQRIMRALKSGRIKLSDAFIQTQSVLRTEKA